MKAIGVNILLLILLLPGMGCKKEIPGVPVVKYPDGFLPPTPVELQYPFWFPMMPENADNRNTKQGVALGRKLYYDKNLHPQKALSCSSCHDQKLSFSVPSSGTAVLPHINLGWSTYFLWGGKIEGKLEDAMHFEVEDFFQSDLQHIRGDATYMEMYLAAFGTYEINTDYTARALAQFLRSMMSVNSRFDRYYPGKINPTEQELMGYEIFNSEAGDCFHCHVPPLFTDNSFHNIGLDTFWAIGQSGRMEVTKMESDRGLFKTPTLRNLTFTAPYMHDGRFATLREVIEHYDHGVKFSSTLDPIMTKVGKESGLQLTESEKDALLAFLLSLNDSTFISDTAFQAP